jgi:uncharacterized protein YndB with AHSA1/START domain
VELEVEIHAPSRRVWAALVDDTRGWWRKDFYALEDPVGMFLEPKAGGRLYEANQAGGEVLWATVIAVNPGRSLDFVGHLTAAYGGPTMTMLHLELEESGEGTLLKLSDSLLGRVDEGTAAEMKKGWWQLFGEGLKPYVESSNS